MDRRATCLLVVGLLGCGGGDAADPDADLAATGAPPTSGAEASSGAEATSESEASSESGLELSAVTATDEDWGVVRDKARWAYQQGLDSLPMGALVARIAETFVGTPYAAHTLELPGEERLIVELNELDCVTFVESALAIARLVKSVPAAMLDDDLGRYRFMYAGILENIRYRGGDLDGYPSRLHYFSEWISDNDRMGIVQDVTPQMDGSVLDGEPIDFMPVSICAGSSSVV